MNRCDLNSHRDILLRYAYLHLRHDDSAEDVVQETLLAALQAQDSFRNESTTRTWLVGILKHKIADFHRASAKQQPLSTAVKYDNPDETLEQLLFDWTGHWISSPSDWHNPEQALENREFWAVFDWCQRNLAEQPARAFMLREMVGLDVPDICADMGITPNACWVYLHRARLGLRECLELRWFNSPRHT